MQLKTDDEITLYADLARGLDTTGLADSELAVWGLTGSPLIHPRIFEIWENFHQHSLWWQTHVLIMWFRMNMISSIVCADILCHYYPEMNNMIIRLTTFDNRPNPILPSMLHLYHQSVNRRARQYYSFNKMLIVNYRLRMGHSMEHGTVDAQGYEHTRSVFRTRPRGIEGQRR